MFEKLNLADHWLTKTGRTRQSEDMNIVFSCMNFQLTSAKQTTLHKQGSTQINNTLLSMTGTHFSLQLNLFSLVSILHVFTQFSFILHVSVNQR